MKAGASVQAARLARPEVMLGGSRDKSGHRQRHTKNTWIGGIGDCGHKCRLASRYNALEQRFLLRRLSRRFSTPPNFRLLQQNHADSRRGADHFFNALPGIEFQPSRVSTTAKRCCLSAQVLTFPKSMFSAPRGASMDAVACVVPWVRQSTFIQAPRSASMCRRANHFRKRRARLGRYRGSLSGYDVRRSERPLQALWQDQSGGPAPL
jgi:hypothetical protein